MLPNKIAFVDVETTGISASRGRIIEIGILRVEDNKLVKTFQSLINPQTYLPKEITQLTGIKASDLENAPTFRSIKDDILEILADCTFVAHNVRFDYSFLKHEFMRENFTYNANHFCTVRLSRILFPQLPRHNLDALIQNCNIACESRHRAFDDASVLFSFYQHIQETLSLETVELALKKTLKKPSLPIRLPFKTLETLPDKPGIYIFYGAQDSTESDSEQNQTDKKTRFGTKPLIPLYVGKSINMRISQQIENIETITTAGELGALFLESQMIKELLPIYNKRSRIKHELIALRTQPNTKGYQECFLEPITTITPENLENFVGFFRSRKQAKAFLADIAKNYTLCEKLLGLEKTSTTCFAHRLARCHGACIGTERPEVYNLRLTLSLETILIHPWPYKGIITIEESEIAPNEPGSYGKKEYFLIHNWYYVGNIVTDAEGNINDNLQQSVTFDMDMYKILRQFLKNPANKKKIQVNPKTEILSASKQLLHLLQ